jgi:(1->4)-alpha-D-glucan 1-alpha-D-glucosylmutase
VDYAVRADLLAALDARGGGLTPAVQADHASELDAAKLWVTTSALRLRRDRPEAFGPGASYEPLLSSSPHALGFVRAGAVATVVTRWPGLLARTGWRDAAVSLPRGIWRDVLTGTEQRAVDGMVACEALLAGLPVALLVRED